MSENQPAIPDFIKDWVAPERRPRLREAVEALAEAKFDQASSEFIPSIQSARWSTDLLRMLAALTRADTPEECRRLWPTATQPDSPADRSAGTTLP